MNWKYEIFEEHCSCEFEQNYIMYGIKAFEDDKIVKVAHFVSRDYEKIKAFTKCLNDGQLDPIHLPYVLHDNMDIYHVHSLK